MEKILFATNVQKIINFFIEAGNDWYGRAIIEKKTGLSKAGVNFALPVLAPKELDLAKFEGKKIRRYWDEKM